MAETPASKDGKKSPKKLLIIIAAVVVLIGAGVGGFLYMKKASNASHAEEAGKDGHASAEHKEEASQAEIAEPEVFYDLPSPLVVDFPPGGSAKVIKVSLTVLVKGEASVGVLKKHEPMIRNNLLMAISALGAEKAKTSEGKQELRSLMLTEIGKVLEKMSGKNTAKDVYFTEFVMQ